MGRPKIKRTEEERKALVNKMMNDRYHNNPTAKAAQIKYTKNWVENNRDEFNSYQRAYREKNPEKKAKWEKKTKENIRSSFIEGFFGLQDDYIDDAKMLLVFISEDESEIRLMQIVDNFDGDLKKFQTKVKYLGSNILEGFGLYGVYRVVGEFKKGLRYIKEKNFDCKLKSSTFKMDGFDFDILEDSRLTTFENEYFNVIE
jgi:hypothetical protein